MKTRKVCRSTHTFVLDWSLKKRQTTVKWEKVLWVLLTKWTTGRPVDGCNRGQLTSALSPSKQKCYRTTVPDLLPQFKAPSTPLRKAPCLKFIAACLHNKEPLRKKFLLESLLKKYRMTGYSATNFALIWKKKEKHWTNSQNFSVITGKINTNANHVPIN